ncbi:MAG: alcohol dehydrogenase catalytic domain-containing protein, partial [Planctomycetes bacterium]|nr:alcohol dehydrogenase catalytic domain-containing protein [Planctomycetota bacterium]
MRACALVAPQRLELIDVPSPGLGPHDVRVRPAAVGVCGTDLHIFAGESNFHFDRDGVPIPFEVAPQVLGHEITGTVVEVGKAVADVRVGTRVVVDQGRNCRSERRVPECEYCATGHSHQCEYFQEHGITGLTGGFAEELVVPAVNVLPIADGVAFPAAAMAEPLACVLHCTDFGERAHTRYRFSGDGASRVRTAVVLGAGPAGLLFVQVLRSVFAFDGAVVVCDPSPTKRALAQAIGALAVPPAQVRDAVLQASGGRGAEYVVEATGAGSVWGVIPRLVRKQATVLMYGIGHGDAPMSLLNPVQWREATLVTSVGASGGFDADGRPSVYRRAQELLAAGRVQVEAMLTNRYDGLAAVPRAFTGDHAREGYVK